MNSHIQNYTYINNRKIYKNNRSVKCSAIRPLFSNYKLPASEKQSDYISLINDYSKNIVICTGPAGCGKTMFACQEGARAFTHDDYDKIILTRPTVSADEDIGYLPGNIDDKLAPWTRPMFDILDKYFTITEIERMKLKGTLEIAPLAFMRGRTFENSFIIADEMQNASINQMKMILTRIGTGSKLIITGDPDQSDLKDDFSSGLIDFIERMNIQQDLDHISHIELDEADVQRHPAVLEVLTIYKL